MLQGMLGRHPALSTCLKRSLEKVAYLSRRHVVLLLLLLTCYKRWSSVGQAQGMAQLRHARRRFGASAE